MPVIMSRPACPQKKPMNAKYPPFWHIVLDRSHERDRENKSETERKTERLLAETINMPADLIILLVDFTTWHNNHVPHSCQGEVDSSKLLLRKRIINQRNEL